MSPLLRTSSSPDRSARTAELFRRCTLEKSGTARRRLQNDVVELNLGVADAIASRYSGRGIPDDDLAQVARGALVKATRSFRPEHGADFLSYAVPCIRGELRRHFRDHGWTVRPPRRVQEAEYRIMEARLRLTHELGREPTTSEYAEELDLDEATVVEALTLDGCFHSESLDRTVSSQEGTQASIGDRLGAEDPEYDRSETRVVLAPMIAALPPRDQTVLRLRFVEGLTQREVGHHIGVTQMQVSRILSRVLGQLREQLTAEPALAATA